MSCNSKDLWPTSGGFGGGGGGCTNGQGGGGGGYNGIHLHFVIKNVYLECTSLIRKL